MASPALPRRHRHHLNLHRPRPRRARRPDGPQPVRLSDLILALLGVTLLGGLTLIALATLIGRALTP